MAVTLHEDAVQGLEKLGYKQELSRVRCQLSVETVCVFSPMCTPNSPGVYSTYYSVSLLFLRSSHLTMPFKVALCSWNNHCRNDELLNFYPVT